MVEVASSKCETTAAACVRDRLRPPFGVAFRVAVRRRHCHDARAAAAKALNGTELFQRRLGPVRMVWFVVFLIVTK